MRKILCAAVRYTFSHELNEPPAVVCGVRHFDSIMKANVDLWDETVSNNIASFEQGFLDSEGYFLNRFEALIVAANADQLATKTQPVDRLFSEDLY